MIKILLNILFIFGLYFPLEAFTKDVSLSYQDKASLETFFRSILVNSEAGYVLLGEKPVCIEGIISDESFAFLVGTKYHQFSVELAEGLKVLKALDISDKKVIIHEYNSLEYGYRHVLFINKDAFEKVVRENLSLFQYVLGPYITPSLLLKELTNSETTFSTVLKNDKVLIGILLGYGTQNALFHAKLEDSQDIASLTEKLIPSKDLIPRQYPPLPLFGCLKEDKETTALLASYDHTHQEIRQLLESEDFLSDALNIFEKVFLEITTPSHKKKVNNKHFSPLSSGALMKYIDPMSPDFKSGFVAGIQDKKTHAKEPLSIDKIAKLYAQNTKLEEEKKEKQELHYQIGYQEGVRVGDYYLHFKDTPVIEDILQKLKENTTPENHPFLLSDEIIALHWNVYQKKRSQKLNDAEQFLNEMHKKQKVHNLKSGKLYRHIKEEGHGESIACLDKITLSYTISDLHEKILYQEDPREYPISEIKRMIPGLKIPFLEAKKGEKGILYIHPHLAFPYSCTELGDQLLIVNYEILSTEIKNEKH
jgi:FKBP-type peptidyl-prolyl cis-trans isomerase